MALFPLDTLKTRLQSAQGFLKAGGLRGIYSGLGSAAVGSAPTGEIFYPSILQKYVVGKTFLQTCTCMWVGLPRLHV